MPDLLVEIGTEEIPAGYIAGALDAWREAVTAGLAEAGLEPGNVATEATPRRLVLAITGLPVKSPDREELVTGPPTSAAYRNDKPTQVLEKWAASQSIPLDSVETRTFEEGKGKKKKTVERVCATVTIAGKTLAGVLPDLIRESVLQMPFPKTMRWGLQFDDGRSFVFPRPVRYITTLLDGTVIDPGFPGLPAGAITEGHPFLHSGDRPGRGEAVTLASSDVGLLASTLRERHVMLSTVERQQTIREQLDKQTAALGVEVAPADRDTLVEEVANLVEWPVLVIGHFDAEFLDLPDQVLRASMMGHQRYFPLQSPAGKAKQKGEPALESKGPGRLVNAFATVINRASDDGAIVRGNERVLRARLADAAFFQQEDRAVPLDTFAERLTDLVYHQSLGSYADKTARLGELAKAFSEQLGFDTDETRALSRAAAICKADLVTQMVFEFPELQGVMGGHYAAHHGEPQTVSQAVAEHYRPTGRDDDSPGTRVGAALSLADKLDALAGYFLIGEDQKKGGDPLGLRRLTIGVLRTLAAHDDIHTGVDVLFMRAAAGYTSWTKKDRKTKQQVVTEVTDDDRKSACGRFFTYFEDRLRNWLRGDATGEAGKVRHNAIEAVLGAGVGFGRISDVVRRLAFVEELLRRDDIDVVLELAERTANITKNEDPASFGEPTEVHLTEDAERALFTAWVATEPQVTKALDAGDLTMAVDTWREGLAKPVHTFFDKVLVLGDARRGIEVPDDQKRNRLALLRRIYELIGGPVAALDRIPRTSTG